MKDIKDNNRDKVLLLFLLTSFAISLILMSVGCSGKNELKFSGIIEGREVRIYSQVSGEVVKIIKDEGDWVEPQENLAIIDDKLIKWQLAEAEGALNAAEAKYQEALAGTRKGDLDKAAANVQQAAANVLQSRARLNQAEASLKAMEAQVLQVKNTLTGAQETLFYHKKQLEDMELLYNQGALTLKELEAQREAVNKSLTQVNTLKAQHDAAGALFEAAKREYEAAAASLKGAEAQEKGALGQLKLLEEGSTVHNLEYLLSLKEQAHARTEQVKVMLDNTIIKAPVQGLVLRRHIEIGELVRPGAVLYTILDPENLEITMYIPQEDLSKVMVGKKVYVQVDAFPNKRFTGEIVRINSRAEFTPRNIQTAKERSKIVFAVKVRLQEGFGVLKPGMAADLYLPIDLKEAN